MLLRRQEVAVEVGPDIVFLVAWTSVQTTGNFSRAV